jgi:hypothetical protein
VDSTAYWIIGFIFIFVVGSIMGLRVSPREKALGQTRERARKMGLHPRLIAAPEWIKHTTPSGKAGGMVAFYSVILPTAQLPLMQALVKDQQLVVQLGSPVFNHEPLDLVGIYAVEMQSNYVGIYWDEEADLHGQQLEKMKDTLIKLSQTR